jgi:uroporphyrinogen decarboxylase
MSVHVKPHHLALAETLVAETRAHHGLAPVDLERFWADQTKARTNSWAADCPQLPLGVMMSTECLFDELGIAENWHEVQHNAEYRVGLSRRYNDLAQRLVGRRLLSEQVGDPRLAWPAVKELHDIFEARQEWHSWSYWLQPSASTPTELAALLDRVEARLAHLREFMLPANWAEEKARLSAAGAKPPLYRGQRGPITFACSIYGAENLIFLILDNPALAGRFRDLILKAMLERARLLDEEAGFTPQTAPRGWGWADDNCCLLNPEMYEFFGYPILKGIFEVYSPDPGQSRYQHSDSDMAHLLPILGRLQLTGANFGPTLSVSQIREHLPKAEIHGQLAPFTFSRNEEVNIVAETIRDFEMSQEKRGVVFCTAGSLNNGSRLTGMRLIMAAIQRYCRY